MASSEIFDDLIGISLFLAALWLGGYLFRLVKLSPIVGEILVGVILGPNLLDLVPLFLGNEEAEGYHEDKNQTARLLLSDAQGFAPVLDNNIVETTQTFARAAFDSIRFLAGSSESKNIWVVLGQLGVTLLIMESGMHVDFPTLRKVGMSALRVAIIGTFGPLLLGIAFAAMLGFDAFPDGLAIGAVLAPTSVGIALKLLHEANVLNSVFGQTIVTAAFTDDIFSLVTLTVMLKIASGDLTPFGLISPFLYSMSFMVGTFLIAIYVVPRTIPRFLEFIARKVDQDTRDRAHLASMLALLGLYGYIGNLIGSHLLGAFVAGVSFCAVPRTLSVWSMEMDIINGWLLRIFFGATVGFAVPITELLTFEIFWKGMIVGVFACIMGKVLSGFGLGGKRWVVGWAMVGRGEFAFLVAETLRSTEFVGLNRPFLGTEAFGVSMWALILATFVAPVVFGFVLASQQRIDEAKIGDLPSRMTTMIGSFTSNLFGHGQESGPVKRSKWWITVGATAQAGLLRDIIHIFGENDVIVNYFVNEGDAASDLFSFLVSIPDDSVNVEQSQMSGMVDGRLPSRARGQTMEEPFHRPRFRSDIDFKDAFFRYDVNILIEKLKQEMSQILNQSGKQAPIKIVRAENAPNTNNPNPASSYMRNIPSRNARGDDDNDSDNESDVNANPSHYEL